MKSIAMLLLPVVICAATHARVAGEPLNDATDLTKALQTRTSPRQCSLSPVSAAHPATASAEPDPRLVVSYEPGKLYHAEGSPNFLTVIALRAGEHIASKAAGDTLNWSIGETYEGKGPDVRALILVKPHRTGLKTNLIITTDQRSYDVEISSRASGRFTSLMSWDYGELTSTKDPSPLDASAGGPTDRPTQLNFHYVVAHKRRQPPLWAPVRVFDDGRRTYIEFSDKSAAIASPPLFMTQPDGSDALANYRVRDDYYIVDRVISKAELKFGKNPADVVTITAETSHD